MFTGGRFIAGDARGGRVPPRVLRDYCRKTLTSSIWGGGFIFTGWSVVARGDARAGGGVLHYFSRQQVAKKNVRAPTVCLRARPLRHFLHSRFGVVFAGGEQRAGGGIFLAFCYPGCF